MSKQFYITTPIYYVNASPHIGHAYTTVACDVMARFKRLDGYEVMFLTGTDEHGQKVEQSAKAKGIAPQQFTDEVAAIFENLAKTVGASNDQFIRTTEERHKRACQALWDKLLESGDIYLGSYAGWYAVRDEAFYQEDELTKQEDGSLIAPSGAEVAWVEESSYFFRLSAWEDRLLAHYQAHPDAIMPTSRRNEVLSFIKGGLRDLSISRTTFSWGIPIPQHQPGDDKHIMYVWLDALTNYITALGYPEVEGEKYQNFWPVDVHVVGKDILRFHTVYWPAFLMSAGLEPPKRVFAHGWWTNEGQKISKSLGNVIDPYQLIETYGLDQVRYFMLREIPFGNDADYSNRAMVTRMNSDLANAWGNLIQRTLSMIAKNCEAAVPQPGPFTEADQAMLSASKAVIAEVRTKMDQQAFKDALEALWRVIGDANAYIDEQAPWALRKTDPERMKTVLYVVAESIRCLALPLQAFMPESQAKVLDLLAIPEDQRSLAALEAVLVPGTALPKPSGVFPRYVEEKN